VAFLFNSIFGREVFVCYVTDLGRAGGCAGVVNNSRFYHSYLARCHCQIILSDPERQEYRVSHDYLLFIYSSCTH